MKKNRTRLTPEFWEHDAKLRRAAAERLAYHEILNEGKPSWKDELDPETRRRVEERADEILGVARNG